MVVSFTLFMERQEKICQIALSLVKGVGNVLWKKLIVQFGSAQAVFQSSTRNLIRMPGSSKHLAHTILQRDTFQLAEALLIAHQQKRIQILSFYDKAYPERLKHIIDAPSIIYLRGNEVLNATKIISIVGTRNATAYGKKMVEQFIRDLCTYNVLIVSGLAYGIDIHAHKTAIEYGLPTLAVLAGGLDIIYPASHKKVALAMLKQGGLISEYPLHTSLEAHQFPARNRIIAGISDATVVIEAKHKSGALITASCANTYHRAVFAVPGSIDKSASLGCNNLIKTHQAHLMTNANDLVCMMKWHSRADVKQAKNGFLENLSKLSDKEQSAVQVFQELQKELHIDELSCQSGIPLNQLPSILLQLEVKKIINFLPGNKFKLA